MITTIQHKHSTFAYKVFSAFIAFTFIFSSIIPPRLAQAQSVLNLPQPGVMVTTSPAFIPPVLKGLIINPDNPFQFDFVFDSGDSVLTEEEIKEESTKLIKYFLASLTIPENELWVNLSPYEKDRIIPDEFGQTEMGRDLLAQDYLLKQLTASLMHPKDEVGKNFWDRVYKQAYEKFGTTKIPVNTFNKVWIIPEEAHVYENKDRVFVVDSHLKVMLEEDYAALELAIKLDKPKETTTLEQELTASIIREVLIPEIEREVNEGENFAKLRQIYHSFILAAWYKKNLKQSILNQKYTDQHKIEGLEIKDRDESTKIYQQYVEAFQKGVYNFIKEDYDEVKQTIVPRKYFSGGITINDTSSPVKQIFQPRGDLYLIASNVRGPPTQKWARTGGVSSPVSFDSEEWLAVQITGGKGSRMNSEGPKVLIQIGKKPIIAYFLDQVQASSMPTIVVSSSRYPTLNEYISSRVDKIIQEDDGVLKSFMKVSDYMEDFSGNIIFGTGDSVIFDADFIENLKRTHFSINRRPAIVTFASGIVSNPESFTRIVRRKDGKIENKISQHEIDLFKKYGKTLNLSDGVKLTGEQLNEIKEIDVGIFIFNATMYKLFSFFLKKIPFAHRIIPESQISSQKQSENQEPLRVWKIYLRGFLFKLAQKFNLLKFHVSADEDAILNLNTPEQLQHAEAVLLRQNKTAGLDVQESGEGSSPVVIDKTKVNHPGGIDFNPDYLNIQSQGNKVQIPVSSNPNEYQNIKINGLVPFIFDITPITNIPLLLGESEEQSDEFSLSQLN